LVRPGLRDAVVYRLITSFIRVSIFTVDTRLPEWAGTQRSAHDSFPNVDVDGLSREIINEPKSLKLLDARSRETLSQMMAEGLLFAMGNLAS